MANESASLAATTANESASPFEIDFARRLLDGSATPEREALARLVSQFDALVNRLAAQDSHHAELQTSLKIARSNLVLAEANAEALEETLKRQRGGPIGSNTPDISQGAWEQNSSTASSPTFGVSAAAMASGSDKLAFWKRKKSNGASGLVPPQGSGRGRSPSPGVERSPILDSPDLSTSPTTPQQPDAELQLVAARLANAHSLLEQERRTTRRQHEALGSLKTSHTALETDHATLRSAHESLQNEHQALHKELETLSQALFEEANKMVAVEREEKSKLEEELADLRGQLEELRMGAEQELEAQLGSMEPSREPIEDLTEISAVSTDAPSIRPATLPAKIEPEAELSRSQQRFRERIMSEPRVEILPPRKQSLSAASAGSSSQPPSRDGSPWPSPRVPDVSTMPPLPSSPGLLQQSASLRKTIPAAVRAASPQLHQSTDGMASIEAVLQRASGNQPSVELLPESPSPKGLSLRSVPPRGASREASPSVTPVMAGVDSFPAQPGAPSPSPSPTSPHGRTWQSALTRPKLSSPSIDDALASIAADADSIISEPVTLSPAQSLRGKAQYFSSSNDTSPHMISDGDPAADAVELIMDDADLTEGHVESITSAASSATAAPLPVEEKMPEPEESRSQFDDTRDESKEEEEEEEDDRVSIEEPSWLSELKVRRRPAPLVSRPEAFTIPPSTSDQSIPASASDTSLAYAAVTDSDAGSIRSTPAADDELNSQNTPRVRQSGFDDTVPSSPVSASHGARLLDEIYRVQHSRDSAASSFSASSSVLAAMAFPHRGGEVPNALKKSAGVGLLATLAPEHDSRLRTTSAASNRSGKSSAPSGRAGTPIGDDLDRVMAQIDSMGDELGLSDEDIV